MDGGLAMNGERKTMGIMALVFILVVLWIALDVAGCLGHGPMKGRGFRSVPVHEMRYHGH